MVTRQVAYYWTSRQDDLKSFSTPVDARYKHCQTGAAVRIRRLALVSDSLLAGIAGMHMPLYWQRESASTFARDGTRSDTVRLLKLVTKTALGRVIALDNAE